MAGGPMAPIHPRATKLNRRDRRMASGVTNRRRETEKAARGPITASLPVPRATASLGRTGAMDNKDRLGLRGKAE